MDSLDQVLDAHKRMIREQTGFIEKQSEIADRVLSKLDPQ